MKPWLVAVLLAIAWAKTWACSCVSSPPPEEAFKGATAVFCGRVVSLRLADETPDSRVECIFELVEIFKGAGHVGGPKERPRITVHTGSGGGDCGYSFSLGAFYLVYAHGETSLDTSICSRTRAYSTVEKSEWESLQKLRR